MEAVTAIVFVFLSPCRRVYVATRHNTVFCSEERQIGGIYGGDSGLFVV